MADLEESVGADNHALSAALGAGFALAVSIGAGALAGRAVLDDVQGELAPRAESGLFEIDFQVEAEIASIPKGISTKPITIGNSIITLPRSLLSPLRRFTLAPFL